MGPAGGPEGATLWQGSAAGLISCVASDHSPRVPAQKEPGRQLIFLDSQGKVIPFGFPSPETRVSLMYGEGVVKCDLPLTWLASVLSENPARIFGLYPRKGSIRIGADGDPILWDPAPIGRSRPASTWASSASPPTRARPCAAGPG